MKRIEATIFGRVQMVMFRDFTKRQANKLGVVGMVENRADGTVHVIAEGVEEALKQLVKRLHSGPIAARVDKVVIDWQEATNTFETFSINYY